MRGHVRKRGTKWVVVVDVGRDESGKRLRKWHSGFERRKDAERALTEILGRLEAGAYVEPAALTLGGFLADEWLPAMRASLRPLTLESYSMIVRTRIAPEIGQVRLQRLTPGALNALYATLGERLSPRSVRYTHAVLRHALVDAVRWQRLARNVADAAEPPSAKAAKAQAMQTWSAEQLAAFLEHVGDDRLYAAWRLAAMTGLRRGEVLGLRWRDLDLEAGRLAVVQTLVGERTFSQPKTDHGRRNVALDPVTVTALRTHRKRQAAERLALGPAYRDEQELVFCREDGEPLWPQSFSRSFERHAKAAGLPAIRAHDLRHTHATLALAAGIHPKVVSERLGHASVGITLDIYSHATPAMQADAANRVAALLEP
ncbi:MAG: site-specific integrase [Solirubrobacterales bacterium]|nr:site-specific integrase [Solirubrobacterales bacterium]